MDINWGQGLTQAALFMGVPAIIIAIYAQYSWWKTCTTKIKVLEVKNAGGSKVSYVAREGSDVTIENKDMGITKTWPINQLATIPMPYPELGILPRWLQREIQTVILHEGDIEPLLNRSPHREKIMSPDMVKVLLSIADKCDEDVRSELTKLVSNVSTGPTRELIANPAIMGDLKASGVMKALATVSNDLLEALKNINKRLSMFVSLNPTYVYIGLALAVILSGVSIYFSQQASVGASANLTDMANKVNAIYNSLGIK